MRREFLIGTITWKANSPIADAAVGVEGALQHFLLEGMALDSLFVDFDSKPRLISRPDEATIFFDCKTFSDDFFAPGHIEMHAFANDVTGRGKSQLQRCGRADRALRVVRRQSNP